MTSPKRPGFDKKITVETLCLMRDRFRGLPEMSHDERANTVAPEFPQFSVRTLKDYSRMCVQGDDDVFQAYVDGKISIGMLQEITVLDRKTQRFLLTESLEKKLTPIIISRIKQHRREHGSSWAEAIGRATGKIDVDQPRRGPEKKDLNQLLDRIGAMGARWRAMVSEAMELIGEEEGSAGIHEHIFSKAYLLRHNVKEQLEFLDAKLRRYMKVIRKRLTDQMARELKEGDTNGNDHGTLPERGDREEVPSRED